jgi:hypothetical protein
MIFLCFQFITEISSSCQNHLTLALIRIVYYSQQKAIYSIFLAVKMIHVP